MSFSKSLLVVSAVLILSGCEMAPDPGAPRAPLPSEIKKLPPRSSEAMPTPRDVTEVWKELEAKKAKKAADEAAAQRTPSGPTAPASQTTPKD